MMSNHMAQQIILMEKDLTELMHHFLQVSQSFLKNVVGFQRNKKLYADAN